MSDLIQQVKDFFESDEGREYVLESTYKHIMQLKLMDINLSCYLLINTISTIQRWLF